MSRALLPLCTRWGLIDLDEKQVLAVNFTFPAESDTEACKRYAECAARMFDFVKPNRPKQ